MTFWTWIEQHQTLTVGIIGLSGVIVTLWHNARQVGIQRSKELFQERQALRAALAEELKINRESFARSIDFLTTNMDYGPKMEYWVSTDQMDDAYRSFIDRIGLLSQFEVRKVMNAYLSLRSYNATLIVRADKELKTGSNHVPVPSEGAQMLLGMQESNIAALDEAIAALERSQNEDRG